LEDEGMSSPIPISVPGARSHRARAGRSKSSALALAIGLVVCLPAVGAGQQCGAIPIATVADGRGAPDTIVKLGPCLSLETIITRTLAHSPSVASAAGTVRDASASRLVAVGAYLPTLNLNSVAGWSNQVIGTTGTGTATITPAAIVGTPISNTYGAGLAALYDVYTGGRRSAQRTQADWTIRAADAGLTLQRYATIFTATQGYLNVLRAHDLTRVAADEVAQAGLGLEYVLRREAVGTAMRADVLSAQLAVSVARQAQIAAADTLAMTAAALGRLVGANGPVDAEPGASLEPTPLAMSDLAILQLAVTTAPAVLTTQAQATADTAAVRAAKSFYLPTISAGAVYNWANISRVPGQLRPGWSFLFSTSFPLFDGYLRHFTVTQAEVASDVAAVTAADTRRLVGSSAEQLLGSLHVAEHNIELTRESVRLATENLRVFRARYGAGISTILDVLTAQTSLIQAELSLVSARFNFLSTRASLEALLGRPL
jgi:outer membrane protein